ncbi:regulatory protein BlaR1 [Lachnospiraceae bacterium]|mgnify:CR=1 FL=1|jgi:bla regulator protein BlaR1|nr:regulatory protein BlaR1 [Lachnospiraceae bacterium]GFI70065.1 regulatory protein BlaR1 [Lachnospiraceae bacterium]
MSMIVVRFTKNQLVFNAEENMRKLDLCKIYSCILAASFLGLTACSKEDDSFIDKQQVELKTSEEITRTEEVPKVDISQTEKAIPNEEVVTEPIITETDWSDYFEGINGAAVIYNPTENSYQIYDQELALTQRSPCSTFKIISSLIALENGIIEPDNSTRTWSGEIFWNEEWNRDIDFSSAFHASCVWYFREVIDEIGKDTMQEELKKLEYGNCDISDWAGRLNANNNNPVLTGFWIESSLLVSPKEQAEVMQRIFGDNSDYSEKTLEQLKQVMLLPEQNETDISIYGKTGMGKAYGIVVDSWYTGFADTTDNRIYFCVYLGETDNQNVSSAKAREIAIKIVSDYLD